MKKKFILITAAIAMLFAACKKELQVTVSSNIVAPVLMSPTTGAALAVTAADSSQTVSFIWTKANYGVPAVINYFIQVDSAGRNFSKAITIGNSQSDTLSVTLGSLNSRLLGSLNVVANGASGITVRVGSAIYGKDSVFSKPITLSFNSFKVIAPPLLYLPGSYEGYSPATAPTIPQVTTYTYEGYAYFNASGNFKFTSAPDYNHINYGDGGNGTLTTNGAAGGISYPSAGYYKLNADIMGLTYSAVLIQSFGIIGTSTAQGWNASTPMTFNQAKGTWSITTALVAGALKFRANDAWDINYGPANSSALVGTLIQTNDAITIPTDGNYTVTIDMSQSTQKAYLYTVVKN